MEKINLNICLLLCRKCYPKWDINLNVKVIVNVIKLLRESIHPYDLRVGKQFLDRKQDIVTLKGKKNG